jgi:hypothetical protein
MNSTVKPNQIVAFVCVVLAFILLAIDKGYIDPPGPGPAPTPKPTVVWAIVVEESGDRDSYGAEYSATVFNPEVRQLFPVFRLVDKDDTVEAKLDTLVQKAKAQGLPRLFLVDPVGTVHWEGEVPGNLDAWKTLVQQVKS